MVANLGPHSFHFFFLALRLCPAEYYDELMGFYERHRDDEKSKSRSRANTSGLSQEDLLRQQQQLFELAAVDPVLASQHEHNESNEL